MTAFDTRNGHVTIDTATHKAVPKDAVVLDLDWIRFEPYGLPDVLERLRFNTFTGPIADQIEAQTKPPRIPEPGWGVVVEASVPEDGGVRRWIKVYSRRDDHWWMNEHDAHGAMRRWDDLVDPEVVEP